MRKLQRSLLASAVALALAASGNAAAQFSNVYFFGDSLTDAGLLQAVLPPGTGLFTTNPGPVWAQVFGAELRLRREPVERRAAPTTRRRRARHAAAGRRRIRRARRQRPCRSRRRSRSSWRKGPADPKALYSVWGGAQRHLLPDSACCRRARLTPAQVQADVGLAAVQLAQQVARLHAGGRAIHHRLEPARHRQDAGGAGDPASGRSAQRALVALQHDAVSARSTPRGIHDDPRQHVRAAERNPREPGRVRVRERRHARACTTPSRHCTARPRTSSRRTRRTTYLLRRRRPPDDRGPRDHRAGRASR